MSLPAASAVRLLKLIEEKNADDMLFQRWCVYAQNIMSFDEFKEKLKPKAFRPESELMADTEKILNAAAGGAKYGNI